MTIEVIASLEDQRAAGVCREGTSAWFRKYAHLDLNYRTFCREGYSVSRLRETGDPLAEKVCVAAEQRVEACDG